ncbi:hypothetical protein [Chitinibacter sp. ZOR0017]|uniref:hypothetical protein n=1 Tax=Chitinibacter sp. ZOR0017 TaxID=1339254 RepID=UPI0012E005ED|nr:hypothetical protein [Chitinibacter sp. ZOR0017]
MAEPWIKRRNLRINSAAYEQVNAALFSLPGLLALSQQDTKHWLLEYDVRALQFGEIASALQHLIPATWFWRWSIRLYQYQDENNRDALMHKDRGCCNRPPSR